MGKGQRIKQQRRDEQAATSSATSGRGARLGHAPSSRTIPWFYISIALIGVVFLAVLLWPGGSKQGTTHSVQHEAFSTITMQGTDALPTFDSSYTNSPTSDPAVGTPAPVGSGESPTGKPVQVGGPSGSPTMMIFVAHWCPHCQREIPQLQSWIAQHGTPAGAKIMTVATASGSSKPNYPPSEWLDREHWQPSVLLDDEVSTVGTAYGVDSYPYFVMVGADGKVVERGSGELTTKQWEAYMTTLEKLAKQ